MAAMRTQWFTPISTAKPASVTTPASSQPKKDWIWLPEAAHNEVPNRLQPFFVTESSTSFSESAKRLATGATGIHAPKRRAVCVTPPASDSEDDAPPEVWAYKQASALAKECDEADDDSSESAQFHQLKSEEAPTGKPTATPATKPARKAVMKWTPHDDVSQTALDCSCMCSAFIRMNMQVHTQCQRGCGA